VSGAGSDAGELDEELRSLGLDEAARSRMLLQAGADEAYWVHPENWRALQVFLAIATQWRTCGSVVIGLDYAAARAGAEMLGLEASAEDWRRVQLIEHAVVRELGKARD